MMECSLWRYQSYLASHARSFITPPFLNSTRPTPTCAPISHPTRPSLFHQQTPRLHSAEAQPSLFHTLSVLSFFPFPAQRTPPPPENSSCQTIKCFFFWTCTAHCKYLSYNVYHMSQLLVFFYTPINCEVHGKRMVSFSERSPQCLVHGRCQRALSARKKEQTDEGRMNACV